MMKSIIEYKDYREYVLEYYRERKRTSAFTWREFAKIAGFASGSYLKLVCDGKTRLRLEGAKKTAHAMGLQGFEYDYFILMVRYESAKTDKEKKMCYEEMEALSSAHNVKILGSEFFTFYETWKHSVVRELAVAMPGAKPHEIAKACRLPISAAEVSNSLRFLVIFAVSFKGDLYLLNILAGLQFEFLIYKNLLSRITVPVLKILIFLFLKQYLGSSFIHIGRHTAPLHI